ncbi:WSC-domain-containing protein [Calocera cornea HHB12733]|uniref:WSC-domain-containing protein n=1 Tax=Calocera cornea HHB12733 TaxID=1353952 RepID=A0A165JTW9_9BASI|nr:WSC-domain-containing protein [Calocera cornea HHB12733]
MSTSTNAVSTSSTTTTSASVPSSNAVTFVQIGCYSEPQPGNPDIRGLNGAFSGDQNDLTIQGCLSYCASLGFVLAGVENGDQCYCGNTVDNGASPSDGCDMPCSGDSTNTCGGNYRLTLFANVAGVTSDGLPVPTTAPGDPALTTAVLPIDTLSGSPTAVTTNPAVTTTAGTTTTTPTGAVESSPGSGTISSSGSGSSTTSSTTTTLATATGGGIPIVTNTLSVSGTVTVTVPVTVSQPAATPATGTQTAPAPAYTYAGCFSEPTDSVTGNIIHSVANLTTVEAELTVEVCVNICANLNYPYAAVEAGDECFCSDGLYFGAVPASLDACATACLGNPAETCGGTNHFDLYADPDITLALGAGNGLPPGIPRKRTWQPWSRFARRLQRELEGEGLI